MDWIYDIETYPNCFTLAIMSADKKEAWVFEISNRRNDDNAIRKLMKKIYVAKDRMVGYNNIGFDYPVIHYLLKNKGLSVDDIYSKAMGIISSENKFEHTIAEHKMMIPQLDLYKIHHFDNKAKATSLKMLEFNMRSDNIEDLPFEVGRVLTDDEIDVLIKYNQHDVYQTYLFYRESLGAISFREKLSQQYGHNFMNHNDTKIGKDYFILNLEKENPGCCYYQTPHGKKIRQTKRKSIDVGEIIFPYIKFDRPEFNAMLDWFKTQTITETKGVFTDILEHELGDVAKYAELKVKKKKLKAESLEKEKVDILEKYPSAWFEDVVLKSGKISHYAYWRIAEALNVVVDGLRYDFGTGGLHASVPTQSVVADMVYRIRDEDVSSFYPNLAIMNRVYPEHLGEKFCDIYLDTYNERKKYPKGTPENAVMKLALNGTYGASNDKFSPFYDPKFTMAITINGQLSLCMLAEKLLEIPDLEIIQVNTDGLTFKVAHDDFDKSQQICREWERITKLELEGADYSRMFIANVNNYIAEYTNGKVKRKGSYEYEDLGWHQNQSALVVKMAAEHSLVKGGDVGEFIRNHDNKYDFMLRTKVPRSSRLILEKDGAEIPQQNICRYYVANNGGQLTKIMPPLEGKEENGERFFAIEKGWLVKTCNNIKDYDGDLNYDYYIEQANKLAEGMLTED